MASPVTGWHLPPCHQSHTTAGTGSGAAAAAGTERSDPPPGAEQTCPGGRELQSPGAGASGMPARRGAHRGKPCPPAAPPPEGRCGARPSLTPLSLPAGSSGDVPSLSPRHLLPGGRVLRRSHPVPRREQGPAGSGDGGERQPLRSLPAGVSPAGGTGSPAPPSLGAVSSPSPPAPQVSQPWRGEGAPGPLPALRRCSPQHPGVPRWVLEPEVSPRGWG